MNDEPKIIESPHIAAILEIFKQQNEIIQLMANPQVYIPASSGIDWQDVKKK